LNRYFYTLVPAAFLLQLCMHFCAPVAVCGDAASDFAAANRQYGAEDWAAAETALASFAAEHARDPRAPDARYMLAEAQLRLNKFKAAALSLRAFADDYPTNKRRPKALMVRAAVSMQPASLDMDGGLWAATELLTDYPGAKSAPYARRVRAQCLMQKQDYAAATVAYCAVLQDDPGNVVAGYGAGAAAFRDKSYPAALKHLSAFLTQHRADRHAADARLMRAVCYEQLKNDPDARKDFLAIARLALSRKDSRRQAECLYRAAECLVRLKRPSVAAGEFETVAALPASVWTARSSRRGGDLLFAASDFNRAAALYHRLLKQSKFLPEGAAGGQEAANGWARFRIAECERRDRKFVAATASYQTFVEQHRDVEQVPAAYYGWGLALWELKDRDAATLKFQTAVDHKGVAAPLRASAQFYLAERAMEQQQWSKASGLFKAAAGGGAGDLQILCKYERARCLRAQRGLPELREAANLLAGLVQFEHPWRAAARSQLQQVRLELQALGG